MIGPVVRGFAWDKDAPDAIIPDPGERMAPAAADADPPLKTIEKIASVEGACSSGVASGGHDFVRRLHEELEATTLSAAQVDVSTSPAAALLGLHAHGRRHHPLHHRPMVTREIVAQRVEEV